MTPAAPGHHPDPTTVQRAGADVSGAPAPADESDLAAQVDLLQAVIRRFGIEDAVARIVALEDLHAEIAVQQRKLSNLIAQVREAERQLTP